MACIRLRKSICLAASSQSRQTVRSYDRIRLVSDAVVIAVHELLAIIFDENVSFP